ncbi:deleted in malignant brain tumors 1 protein-like isoform X2 [Pecten maximus]|nr:deleted in malignant brain tumors 1 protein-like isoform X2 [Pecten maximus]
MRQVLSKCARAGGHLVNIETEKENHFLSNTLQLLYPDSDVWLIGGKIHRGKWYWEKHISQGPRKPKGPKKPKKPKKPKNPGKNGSSRGPQSTTTPRPGRRPRPKPTTTPRPGRRPRPRPGIPRGPKSTKAPRPGRRPRPRPGPKRQLEIDLEETNRPNPPSPPFPTQRPGRNGNRARNKHGKKGKKNKRRSKRAAKKKKGGLKLERNLIVYKKWFPGWVPTNEGREPSRGRKEYCMVLNNLYDRPDGSFKQLLDYYYWDNVSCKRRTGFNYICEKPKTVGTLRAANIDCYEGNGANYRGTMDLTTKGTPCVNWTDSDRINPQTHPNKGLGAHNFCRNPDNEARPWCWVNTAKGQYGYCPLFPCTDPTQENNPDVLECYEGNGENYRGSVSRTIRGSECQRWTQSVHINPDTYPDMGLGDHNLCRNPDKSAKPWCWTDVNRRMFGYCPVPQCADVQTDQVNSTEVPDVSECPDGTFFCYTEDKARCIPENFQCDGENDCTGGEDEENCEYKVPLFEKFADTILNATRLESYLHVPIEKCAEKCLETREFVCRSFSYHREDRSCFLTDMNTHLAIDIIPEPSNDHDFYELSSQTADCFNMFQCTNGRCIDNQLRCDWTDDCGDFSDEMNGNCARPTPDGGTGDGETEQPLEVRMVDGDKENSGRVEIRYRGEWGVICDDKWDINDARVVCHMLGYNDANRATHMSEFGSGNGNFLLDDVGCVGNETTIEDCPKPRWKEHNCKKYEVAGVECNSGKGIVCVSGEFSCTKSEKCIAASLVCNGEDDCGDQTDEQNCVPQVKLVAGTSERNGRVELTLNGVVGSICDDLWDDNDATVVCRMAGYQFGGQAKKETYGAGKGVIWMDDVECTGEEMSLADCPRNAWGTHNCNHDEDAGVLCLLEAPTTPTPELAIQVELEGGNATAGRLVATVGGSRGTVCDDHFDEQAATVVCRMLGFDLGITTNVFGEGSGDIVLDDVRCEGTETSLINCTYRTEHNCGHTEDIGVVCYHQHNVVDKVFLVDGPGPHAGRVQVQHNGLNGTVCDDEFDNDNARVVCSMLGFTGGTVVDLYGYGTGKIWLDNVVCDGTEKSLFDCEAREWGAHDCSHEEDVGVACDQELVTSTRRPTPPPEVRDRIRLVRGEGPHEGRVEVLHNNVYGTVCDDGFEDDEAGVLCRMLGYRDGYVVATEYFGPGVGEIWLDDLNCDGTESSLFDCSGIEWGVHNCNHGEDVGVKCQRHFTTTTTQVYEDTISLADGTGSYEGRVVIHHEGVAGTICDDEFDAVEAGIICRMLGFRDGSFAPKGTFPPGDGEIWLDNLECTGAESTLWECPSNGWGVHNCNHGEDVGVVCTNDVPVSTTPKPDIVRLVGGTGPHEGRILIEHTGINGTVCDDYFDDGDARVVCRTLGFRNGMKMDTSSYGQGEGKIWLDDVACTGEEATLWECPDLNWGTHNCNHGEDVGVMCTMDEDLPLSTTTTAGPLTVELVNGPDSSEGRVEVIYSGTRGTVCDDNWGPEDARVVCRMLGFVDGRSKSQAAYGPGSDQILLDEVACTGEETSLMECSHSGWGTHNCDHSEDAGAVCLTEPFMEATASNIQIGLLGGSNENEGVVQLVSFGVEGGLCNYESRYNDEQATLVCKTLGFRSGVLMADPPTSSLTRAWPYTVSCPPASTVLANCTLEENLDADDCPPSSYVGVSCTSEIDPSTAHHTEVVCVDDSVTLQCAGGLEILDATYGRRDRQTCPSGASRSRRCNVKGVLDIIMHICNGQQQCELQNIRAMFSDLVDPCEDTAKYLTVQYNCAVDIQLVNGNDASEGRVEVILEGQRGTVCDDNWSDEDASVVCRMLGYDRGGIALRDAYFGRGSTDTPILMDEVGCDGSETSILSCTRGQGHDCGHHEDAGVRCITAPKPTPGGGGGGGGDDGDSVDDYIFPGCGKRPLEAIINARKKRETDDGYTERVLGQPPRVEKIIGGNTADYGMFPWQVGVRLINYVDSWDNTKYHQHWCGATIVSEYWVLSAAHCFDGKTKSDFLLRVGDLNNKSPDDNEAEFEVETLLNHESYNDVTYNNDIALLKVKAKNGHGIVFNDFIQPACLPTSNTEYTAGKRCHISGWGKTELGTPHMLKQAVAPLISQAMCRRLYSKSQITDAMLCAGLVAGGVDTCQGDSGGPLVCEESTGVYTLYGATSWGAGCGEANAPGVYTHIKNFLPWIRDKLKTHS